MPDGELMAQRDAPVGGQAGLEGVMMRGFAPGAGAVSKPVPEDLHDGKLDPEEGAHGEIEVQSCPLVAWTKKHRVLRWPIIRGVVALVESLKIGFKALGISANAQLPEEEEPISSGAWVGTVVVAMVFAVGLFFVVPVGLTSLIKGSLHSSVLFWLIEGLVRTAIFLGYLLLLSRLRDLRRVFEYHGAEHKTIACYEAGLGLPPPHLPRLFRPPPPPRASLLLRGVVGALFLLAPLR